MQNLSTPIVTRAAYVVANPHDKARHREAQSAMFAACNKFGLGTTAAHRDAMLEGINEAFGLRGASRLISRRQMTVDEMRAITFAVEAGLFSPDWTWGNEFTISRLNVTYKLTKSVSLGFKPRARRA